MNGSGWIWFTVALVQVALAAYAFAAAVSWRGERLFPAPGHPLGRVPAAVAALGFVALAGLLMWVGDSEFSRYLGTGSMMVVAIGLIALLLRRQAREG
jgi:asparagine N-glycosylation enzyme membrane subunit Stt3